MMWTSRFDPRKGSEHLFLARRPGGPGDLPAPGVEITRATGAPTRDQVLSALAQA